MTSNGNMNLTVETNSTECLSRRDSFAVGVKIADATLSLEARIQERRKVKKNLVILYISCILVTSPMYALINSASSLLAYSNVGVQSLAVLGATQLLGAAVMGSYSTKVWGARKIVTISFMLTVLYIFSFYDPILETSILGGAFMGLGYTLLITATFLYGNILGLWYACIANSNLDTVLVLMSGAVNSSLGGGMFLGNILYYFLLTPGTKLVNAGNWSEDAFGACGANYCNEDLRNMTTMQYPDDWRYYSLIGIFSAMGVIGIGLSLFVEDFSAKLGYPLRKKSDFFVMLKETYLLLKDPRGYLLIVMTTFIGIEEAFVYSEFTQAYVSCVIGIPMVGLVMLGLGLIEFISSLFLWIIVKNVGRIPLVGFIILMFMACFITLLVWKPHPDQAAAFYVIAVLWGFGDATIISVVFSVYGLLFEDNIEGSFAVGNFWFSLGYLLSFGWSPFLCIYVKLYILIAFASVGTLFYIILEILIKKNGTLELSAIVAAELPSTLPMVLPVNFGSNQQTR